MTHDAAHPYWASCAEQLRAALAAPRDSPEVYVLALSLLSEDDDARRPFLALSWNTEQHLAQKRLPRDRLDAGRLRWMTGSYVAQHAAKIGVGADDLRRDWVASVGGWYSNEDRADVDTSGHIDAKRVRCGARHGTWLSRPRRVPPARVGSGRRPPRAGTKPERRAVGTSAKAG